MKALLKATNVTKTYDTDGVKTHAVRGISLQVTPGEFVAIMGPSGSGKSTLLHILGFLDRPTTGSYRFMGKTMQDYTEDQLAHIRNKKMGFVFQMFNLLPRTSVLDNVKLPLLYSDVKESEWDTRAKDALEAVGLSHRVQHESSQLSGGEKQRAAIARALINTPEIIFADEPTGNLDSTSGKQIMSILQKLNEERGHTIVLITHETYTAAHAQRLIRLKDGAVESDKPITKRMKSDEFIK